MSKVAEYSSRSLFAVREFVIFPLSAIGWKRNGDKVGTVTPLVVGWSYYTETDV